MRSRNGVAYDFLSRSRPLGHLAWLCRLLSPFATAGEVAAAEPRRIDWPTVVDLASWNGLLVSVYPALEERGLLDRAPADALAALQEFHVQGRLRAVEAAAQAARASHALNAAGIEPLWMKGAALLVEGSAWSQRRWMSDLDAWVEPAHIDAAHAALRTLGYRHDARYPDPTDHHLRPLFHPQETFAIELHHALTPPAVAAIMPLERVLANARRLSWRDARVVIPDSLDQAIHIATQARPSAAAYLHGRLKTRRVVEFVELASTIGASRAVEALRSACSQAGQVDFGEEFLGLASGMCCLPGQFECRPAMAGLAWKVTFPRLHALYFGFRGLARRGVGYHAMHPWISARKAAVHLRRSMNPRW